MLAKRLAARPLPPGTIGAAYYLFFWSMVASYAPFLNVYFQQLGLSGAQLGILAAVFPFFAFVVSPSLSALADRRSWRRRMLQLNLVGWALVLLLYRFPTTFGAILLLVIVEAAVRSPAIPIADSMIARMATRRRLAYGRMRLWGSLGFAAVSILAGLLWQQVGYLPMFLVAAVAVLPALAIVSSLEEETTPTSASRRSARTLARDPGLVVLYAVALLAGISLFSTFVFNGVYVIALGGTEMHVGLVFGLSALAEVPIMRSSGRLIARLKGQNVLLLALGVLTLSLLGHALAWSPAALIAASAVKGVGYGLFFVVVVQLIDERAPQGWTSTAQAVFQACFLGLAPLSTSTLSGVIYDTWGPAALFGGMTAVLFLAILLLLFALRRRWFAPVTWQGVD